MNQFLNFDQILRRVESLDPVTIAVAEATNPEVILSVKEAFEKKFARFLLYGDQKTIQKLSEDIGLSLQEHQVIHTTSKVESCQKAVIAVHEGKADVAMKGLVHSSDFLRAVLNKEKGLRTGKVLSHVATFEIEGYDRFIHVTDASINIKPNWQEKAQIIENITHFCRLLGNPQPKVALLGAIEVINPKMDVTMEAAILSQMSRRGQLPHMSVDGPLALDNAISEKAASIKKIRGEVAGQADVLVVPDIEAGNILYKSLVYFANAKMGALVLGGKAPIILTSRADSARTRVYSMALAALQVAQEMNENGGR